MSRIIAVHGATGGQGGSVVNALLKSDWKVRAITRNASGEAAKALAAKGVEVVSANFDDETSLTKAYEGVEAIYLVTNFWEHLFTGKGQVESGEAESKQALTVVKLADKLPGLKHFIWSTLPGNAEGQSKRTAVPHFDYKAQLDVIIRKDYPNLAAKTTFFYVGYYANNLVNLAKPFANASTFGQYIWLMPVAGSVVIPSAGDISVNVGAFVKAILAQPQKTQGKYVACVADTITHEKLLEHWSAATGKRAAFVQAAAADWNKAYGPAGEELYLNLKAFEENDKWYLDNAPLLAKDLGIENEIVNTENFLKNAKESLL